VLRPLTLPVGASRLNVNGQRMPDGRKACQVPSFQHGIPRMDRRKVRVRFWGGAYGGATTYYQEPQMTARPAIIFERIVDYVVFCFGPQRHFTRPRLSWVTRCRPYLLRLQLLAM
jgi:hypothetical protein